MWATLTNIIFNPYWFTKKRLEPQILFWWINYSKLTFCAMSKCLWIDDFQVSLYFLLIPVVLALSCSCSGFAMERPFYTLASWCIYNNVDPLCTCEWSILSKGIGSLQWCMCCNQHSTLLLSDMVFVKPWVCPVIICHTPSLQYFELQHMCPPGHPLSRLLADYIHVVVRRFQGIWSHGVLHWTKKYPCQYSLPWYHVSNAPPCTLRGHTMRTHI